MTGATAPPAPFTGRGGRADAAFRYATIAAGLVVLVVLGAIAVTTVRRALPAFDLMGFRFLTSSRWDPNADQFGAKAFLYGSLVASAIAATAWLLLAGLAKILDALGTEALAGSARLREGSCRAGRNPKARVDVITR